MDPDQEAKFPLHEAAREGKTPIAESLLNVSARKAAPPHIDHPRCLLLGLSNEGTVLWLVYADLDRRQTRNSLRSKMRTSVSPSTGPLRSIISP